MTLPVHDPVPGGSFDSTLSFSSNLRDRLPHTSLESEERFNERVKTEGYLGILKKGQQEARELAFAPDLNNGWNIVQRYSELTDQLLRHFLKDLQQEASIVGKWTFCAHGGTGRAEVTPNSDWDVVLFLEDPDQNEKFIDLLTDRLPSFSSTVRALPAAMQLYGFSQIVHGEDLSDQNLASFLDLRRISGSATLLDGVRGELRAHALKAETSFYLTKIPETQKRYRDFPQDHGEVDLFHIKEGKGGLRDFHLGCWFLGMRQYEACRDVYKRLPEDVINAYAFELKARTWRSFYRGEPRPGSERSDRFEYEHFRAFRRDFGDEGFAELIRARKTLKHFCERCIDERVATGIPVGGGIVYREGGLGFDRDMLLTDKNTLFYRALLARQTLSLPLDSQLRHTFRSTARHNIAPHPLFLCLLESKGSRAATLSELYSMDMLNTLIPLFSSLETALYGPEHRLGGMTHARRALERVRNIERLDEPLPDLSGEGLRSPRDAQKRFFYDLYQRLSPLHAQAIVIALVCEEIPKITALSTDAWTQLFQKSYPEAKPEMIRVLRFLMENKRLLVDTLSDQLPDAPYSIRQITSRTLDANDVQALLLFTYAAFDHGRTEPNKPPRITAEGWEQIICLGRNAMNAHLGVEAVPSNVHQDDAEGQLILSALPHRFHRSAFASGLYNHKTHIDRLKAVLRDGKTRIDIFPFAEDTKLLQVAAPNFRGLLWRITGTFLEHNIRLRHAEVFVLDESMCQLGLDFFSFDLENGMEGSKVTGELRNALQAIISDRNRDVSINAAEIIQQVASEARTKVRLDPAESAESYRLSISGADHGGTLYAVPRFLSEQLAADISALRYRPHRDASIGWEFFFTSQLAEHELRARLGEVFCLSDEQKVIDH